VLPPRNQQEEVKTERKRDLKYDLKQEASGFPVKSEMIPVKKQQPSLVKAESAPVKV